MTKRLTQAQERNQRLSERVVKHAGNGVNTILSKASDEQYRLLSDLLNRLQFNAEGRLERGPRNLTAINSVVARIKSINEALVAAGSPLDAEIRASIKEATDAVDQSLASLFQAAGVDVPAGATAFDVVDRAIVEQAYDNTHVAIRGVVDEQHKRVVQRGVAATIAGGQTREQLFRDFFHLNHETRIEGEKKVRRPALGYQVARAEQQVRAETHSVMQQRQVAQGKKLGLNLFRHVGPKDGRNIRQLGNTARGRFRSMGSRDFIGKVLSADEWSRVASKWDVYGLHYGERGSFVPVSADWPGVLDEWRKSEKALRFKVEPEPEPEAKPPLPPAPRPTAARPEPPRRAPEQPKPAPKPVPAPKPAPKPGGVTRGEVRTLIEKVKAAIQEPWRLSYTEWRSVPDRNGIVNDAGTAMPLYHGTSKAFELSEMRPGKGGAVGPGIYLSKTTELANSWAGTKAGARIIRTYVTGKYLKMPYGKALESAEWVQKAREEGYAGLDTGLGEVLVFDAKDLALRPPAKQAAPKRKTRAAWKAAVKAAIRKGEPVPPEVQAELEASK